MEIPGDIPPPRKKEGQGYIADLSKMKVFELEELLERQNKMLGNKRFISKLPDKGEKITSFRDKIVEELAHQNEVENAANLLSRLNIASEGKAAMNEMEWTGKYREKPNAEKAVELDSDDEEDPLKILAQPTGSGIHKKKVIQLPPEESLIKPEDLEEIMSFQHKDQLEEHIKYIIDKTQKTKIEGTSQKRESFKPYKTTISAVNNPDKGKEKKIGKHWEVTAATPPPDIFCTKSLNIQESLLLQKQQSEKLQEIRVKYATERLAEQLGSHGSNTIPSKVGNYRSGVDDDATSSSSENENENEVHDDEDNDKGGTVVFTVDTIET